MIYQLNESVIPSIIHFNPKKSLSKIDSIGESVELDCKSILEELKILDRPIYELEIILSENKIEDIINKTINKLYDIYKKIVVIIDSGINALSFKIKDKRKFFDNNIDIIRKKASLLDSRYQFDIFEYNVYGNEKSGLSLLNSFIQNDLDNFNATVENISNKCTMAIQDPSGKKTIFMYSDILTKKLVGNKNFDEKNIEEYLTGAQTKKSLSDLGGIDKVLSIYDKLYDVRKSFQNIKKSLNKCINQITKSFKAYNGLLVDEMKIRYNCVFGVMNSLSLYIRICFKVLLNQVQSYHHIINSIYNMKIVEEKATIPIHNFVL